MPEPSDVTLLAEEARVCRAGLRLALETSRAIELLRQDDRVPEWLREKLPEPLDAKTMMVMRLVEDRLPEAPRAVE